MFSAAKVTSRSKSLSAAEGAPEMPSQAGPSHHTMHALL